MPSFDWVRLNLSIAYLLQFSFSNLTSVVSVKSPLPPCIFFCSLCTSFSCNKWKKIWPPCLLITSCLLNRYYRVCASTHGWDRKWCLDKKRQHQSTQKSKWILVNANNNKYLRQKVFHWLSLYSGLWRKVSKSYWGLVYWLYWYNKL